MRRILLFLSRKTIVGNATTLFKNGKALAASVLSVVAFPTMVFLDKNNKIRRIHTGFDGPATSKHADFAKEFDVFVKKLIAE